VDRRSSSRYALRVPVVFHWDDGKQKHSTGISRDLSPAGAYISCENKADCPKRGSVLEVEILLPAIGQEHKNLKLNAKGPVVRTNRSHHSCGFAIRSQFVIHVEADGPPRINGSSLDPTETQMPSGSSPRVRKSH
jgi:hypothetical protein